MTYRTLTACLICLLAGTTTLVGQNSHPVRLIEVPTGKDCQFVAQKSIPVTWDNARSILTLGKSKKVRGKQPLRLKWKGIDVETQLVYDGNETTIRLYDVVQPRSEYFTWINNTNEGATEQQTLANLDYFNWMRQQYGMHLDIYAFDAGAIDGSRWYGTMNSDRFRKHFPHRFDRINDKARTIGTRLGLWGGPDGFGETEAHAEARKSMMESLCRDYNWALFKFDMVCGPLTPAHAPHFADMMGRCRHYSPDLILLNHRLGLEEADSYATTQLWEGRESYTDVNSTNTQTAPHHRAGAMSRQLVPNLKRTVEDHGICLSSCLDHWDDELVLSAFGRNLVLAPQIYGNPWLLRDSEQERLARLFNIHRHYAPIMHTGLVLPAEYGQFAIARGNDQTRVVVLRNLSWTPKTVHLKLDATIGLEKAEGSITLTEYHPSEHIVGHFAYGQSVDVCIQPFRSLLLVAGATLAPNGHHSELTVSDAGAMQACEIPADANRLYEESMFAADNNALEIRSLHRAGETKFAAVQAARDAFFQQKAFVERGIWDRYLFDNNMQTGFYPSARQGEQRIHGGCLRLDLGMTTKVDSIRLRTPSYYGLRPMQLLEGQRADFSTDLATWHSCSFLADTTSTLIIGSEMRYLKVYDAPGQLCEIEVFADGKRIDASHCKASNLFAPSMDFQYAWTTRITIPSHFAGGKICVALEGRHGVEGAYAALRIGHAYVGAPDRAPSYRSNTFESNVSQTDRNYTYFIPITADMTQQDVEVVVLGTSACDRDLKPHVYLTKLNDSVEPMN